MFNTILLWVGVIAIVAGLVMAYLPIQAALKNKGEVTWKTLFNKLTIAGLVTSGGGGFALTLSTLMKGTGLNVGLQILALFTALVLPAAILLFITMFINYFFILDLKSPLRRHMRLVTLGSGLLTLLSLLGLLDSLTYMNLISFPLSNGIEIGTAFKINFYALAILFGAGVTYFISDGYFFRRYGKHGMLENVFYVAFPMGIVGARLWYVIGNWTRDGFDQDFAAIFRIWEGGLAIMGGALLGAIAGIVFFKVRRKYIPVRWAADVIVPAILIAQAIGRWGNFFNQEVYGAVANVSNWWFIPRFIQQQMFVSGDFRIPLFFIESLVNIGGYFLLRYVVGKGLKKYIVIGDLAFGYSIWYGLTRFVLEPLRDPLFNMGADNQWSWIWSIVFIGLGILGIVINHIYDIKHKPVFGEMPSAVTVKEVVVNVEPQAPADEAETAGDDGEV